MRETLKPVISRNLFTRKGDDDDDDDDTQILKEKRKGRETFEIVCWCWCCFAQQKEVHKVESAL